MRNTRYLFITYSCNKWPGLNTIVTEANEILFQRCEVLQHYFKPAASEMIELKNGERKAEGLKERP